MGWKKTKHQTVRDYAAARERGDRTTSDRLKDEAIARFATDGTELRDMTDASMTIPFGDQQG